MSSAQYHQPRILRVSRSDEPAAYVLVHVSSSGSAPLDLRLVATEGEVPYVGSVRQSRLKSLRAKNYEGSDDEWAEILTYVLRQDPPSARNSGWTSGLEVTASIHGTGDGDREIIIAFRKRIDTITQRLGSITLRQDDEQAIELFEWTGITVVKIDALERQVATLSDRYRTAEDTISKLNAQLEELIETKSEHEDQLIARCVQLLNEKKLKIRNQQRLLASANVDPTKVTELETAISGWGHRRAEASRTSKRKAVDGQTEAVSDNDFEKMDVDNVRDRRALRDYEETDSTRNSTPQPLEEEETASEDELEDKDLSSPLRPRENHEQSEENTEDGVRRNTGHLAMEKLSSGPPRRELPFQRTAGRYHGRHPTEEKILSSHRLEDAEETAGETDDDEL